jgi:protein-tyrosine-phosphatase
MAEGFLKHEAARRGLQLDVRSTGTHAWPGRAATYDGRRIMTTLGVPIDDHRTLAFERELVEWADLVIAMATEHTREVERDFPEASAKTFLLKEFIHLLPHLPEYTGDPATWVAEAAEAAERTARPSDLEVDDPFGEREEAYRRVATEIQGLIETMAEGLASKRVGPQA